MSNHLYGITRKTINAILDVPVKIHLCTHVCSNSAVIYDDRLVGMIRRRLDTYEQIENDVTFIVDHVFPEKGVVSLLGSTVYKVPDEYKGTHDEYYFSNHTGSAFGTLLKNNRQWVIETDLRVIEKMRRDNEVERMKQGHLHIGKFGNDHVSYINDMERRDVESGEMVTRGHGLPFLLQNY